MLYFLSSCARRALFFQSIFSFRFEGGGGRKILVVCETQLEHAIVRNRYRLKNPLFLKSSRAFFKSLFSVNICISEKKLLPQSQIAFRYFVIFLIARHKRNAGKIKRPKKFIAFISLFHHKLSLCNIV